MVQYIKNRRRNRMKNIFMPFDEEEENLIKTTSPKQQPQETQKHHSLQAADLESWAFGVWNASIAIAIITFIISGFTYTADFELGFHFLSMFKGIIPAGCLIIGGGVLRVIMNGLAVLVEAASKELTDKK